MYLKMKKRIMTAIVTMSVLLGFAQLPYVEAQAAEEGIAYDHSYLTQDEVSTADLLMATRGVYLNNGSSMISKPAIGKISVSVDTTANTVVGSLKASAIVEKWIADTQTWEYYTSWDASVVNEYYINTSKVLTVPRGYYYRARGIHVANSDVGYSYTNGIWIG